MNSNLLSEQLQVEIKFRYSAWLFVIDQILRFGVLLLYLQDYINLTFFLIIQFLLIGIEIPIYLRYKKKVASRYTIFLNSKYQTENPIIEVDDTIPGGLATYQYIFGFIFSFWFFYHVLTYDKWTTYLWIFILSTITAIVLCLPLLLTVRFRESLGIISATPQIKKSFRDEKKQIQHVNEDVSKKYPDLFACEKIVGYGAIQLDAIDTNDIRITKLESEMKNINFRSEAWMLESVFLGGLSFSGFLTVASANFLGNEPLVFHNFLLHGEHFFKQCSSTNIINWLQVADTEFSRDDLFIMIMLLCLLSSVFFLLVLILRLRLNSMSLNLDHLLRILISFNGKEEELFNMNNLQENSFQHQRLEKVKLKIHSTLQDAEKLLNELKPATRMMSAYRTIAILLFYAVLILSGFYFMPAIAVLILFLLVMTQLIGLFDRYNKVERIKNLLRKH